MRLELYDSTSSVRSVCNKHVNGKHKVNGGTFYLSVLSVSVHKLVCNLYKLLTSHLERRWRQEKKNRDPVPKPMTYALTRSFSHKSHRPLSQFFTSNRCRCGYICGKHSLTVYSHLVLLQKIVSYLCNIPCSSVLNIIHALVLF